MDEEIETNIEQEQEHIEEPALDNSHTSNTDESQLDTDEQELPENQPQQQANPENTITKIDIPNVNTKIKYGLQEDDEWTQATVMGKGGKATGRNKHYVNVQREEDEQKVGIHLDKVEFEVIKNAGSDAHVSSSADANIVFIPVSHHGDNEVVQAKHQELQNWQDFKVYTEVQDHGQKKLSTRWVVTEKTLPNGEKGVKARLVVRGFEEEQQIPSDSPTASKSTLRIVMAIAASQDWKCESIDIKAAFLQGRKIDRDVYLVPPSEVREGVIWKIEKAVYGLADASRNWFFSVKEELLKLNCKQSQLDKALFRWYNNGRLEGVFVMHVDDFLFAGSEAFNKNVIDRVVDKYKVGRREIESFRYVGLDLEQGESGIKVNQDEYVMEKYQ
ncbi:hypothetical protein BSL78_28434 [Apostichopus japonicus]|uniref:Reverse transcriptase Ty1/copia-type domain-containing protein n=1 Tax=Stichopus japonicus TaxID=307972 RepID=A0A2G8JG91_STIJA|nr:hypothetical protein BSL78_28434 [Apostichopus japonicus]